MQTGDEAQWGGSGVDNNIETKGVDLTTTSAQRRNQIISNQIKSRHHNTKQKVKKGKGGKGKGKGKGERKNE